MTIWAATSLSPQPQHKEVNNTLHTGTDVDAKTRGPPARRRVMCPHSTCCHTGGPVASANLPGQTPAPKQTRFAEALL